MNDVLDKACEVLQMALRQYPPKGPDLSVYSQE